MDRETVDFYEAHSDAYEAQRSPAFLSAAQRFGRQRPPGVAIDLGSGPGWYTAALGSPVVALDAAMAMLRRTHAVAPEALAVQADLGALPFRGGSLAAGWARNTYVHLRASEMPMALNDLHRALAPGAPVELTLFGGEAEGRGVLPGDDFPVRWFSAWSESRLRDLIDGAGFALETLVRRRNEVGELGFTIKAKRAQGLPDFVNAGMRLLVCGLNPSERSADAGLPYVTGGNRFWPAALAAGLVSLDRDPRHALRAHGVGFTDLVKRPTPRAAALSGDEYVAGAARLERLCAWLAPAAVCIVGLTGWRAAVDRRALAGWQARELGGCRVYVMPSTSGLNAATPLSALIEHLGRAVAGT